MARGMHSLLVLLALTCGSAAHAAKVYRCGNSYSQTPCSGAVELSTDDPRSADQKAAADRAIANDARTAAAMEKARLQAAKRANEAAVQRKVGPNRGDAPAGENPSGRNAALQGKATAGTADTAHGRKTPTKAQREKKTDQDKDKPFVAKSVVKK
jgi:hypothetical protein